MNKSVESHQIATTNIFPSGNNVYPKPAGRNDKKNHQRYKNRKKKLLRSDAGRGDDTQFRDIFVMFFSCYGGLPGIEKWYFIFSEKNNK